jgi:hypothetical protein
VVLNLGQAGGIHIAFILRGRNYLSSARPGPQFQGAPASHELR